MSNVGYQRSCVRPRLISKTADHQQLTTNPQQVLDPPATNYRSTDRSSTDPPKTDHRPTDMFSTNQPTTEA